MSPTPLNISADRNHRILNISWDDPHISQYPFKLLRAGCPCASCRGGHENMRAEPDPEIFDIDLPDSDMTQIKKIEAVGTYAISFEWEDGHHYGIYNWRYLRGLCTCEECRPTI
jgi:DUF971 family protein